MEWHQGELFPRVGFIVANLSYPTIGIVRFYNGRGTAEQWIKEGKHALNWTRLSCHKFAANQVRLGLFIMAYNLGNFLRRLVLPEDMKHWTLTSLQPLPSAWRRCACGTAGGSRRGFRTAIGRESPACCSSCTCRVPWLSAGVSVHRAAGPGGRVFRVFGAVFVPGPAALELSLLLWVLPGSGKENSKVRPSTRLGGGSSGFMSLEIA